MQWALISGVLCFVQGKNYVVLDGDIIYFKFNVTSSAKK